MKSRIPWLLLMALLGLLDALYLAYERLFAGTLACPVTGGGCSTVQTSWYAAPFGMPISYIGVAGYGLILAAAAAAKADTRVGRLEAIWLLKGLVYTAAVSSMALLVVQAFAIHAYCFWCVVSATLSFSMVVTVSVPVHQPKPVVAKPRHRGRNVRSPRATHWAWWLLIPVAVGSLILLVQPGRPAPVVATIPAIASGPIIKGDAKAPVTVVIYSDYQCPACAAFATQVEPLLDKTYVETGKVKVEHRDFPLSQHANAVPAAMAARLAGDYGQYWQMHALLSARLS